MKRIAQTIPLLLLLFLAACYYDNVEEIYPPNQNNQSATCDTTNVSYASPLQSFFDNKCNGCHGGSHPTANFNTQNNAHAYVAANGMFLYDKVASGSHNSITLTSCEKAQLKKWIELGGN